MTQLTQNRLNPSTKQERSAEARKTHDADRRREAEQMVFAVRLPPPSTGYGWEIRRFGNFVLDRSQAEFRSSVEAKAAGEAFLAQGLRS